MVATRRRASGSRRTLSMHAYICHVPTCRLCDDRRVGAYHPVGMEGSAQLTRGRVLGARDGRPPILCERPGYVERDDDGGGS